MRTSFSPRRLTRRLLAVVFAGCATTYSVLWIMHQEYVHPQPGFTNYEYSASNGAMQVGEVFPASPADKAGLRPGDRIIAIDGHPLADCDPFTRQSSSAIRMQSNLRLNSKARQPDSGKLGL